MVIAETTAQISTTLFKPQCNCCKVGPDNTVWISYHFGFNRDRSDAWIHSLVHPKEAQNSISAQYGYKYPGFFVQCSGIWANSEKFRTLSFPDFDPEFSEDLPLTLAKMLRTLNEKTRFRSKHPEFLKILWVLSFFRLWVLSVLHKK